MIEAILLGLLQGLTEFLPVSSSGHILFAQKILSNNFDLPLIISVHMGTAFAILIYFRYRIRKMVYSIIKTADASYKEERKLWKYLILASIPAAIAGFLIEPKIDQIPGVTLISACWIVNGLILIFGEFLAQEKQKNTPINLLSSSIVGIAQAIAILPGISRSGITIIAGKNAGLKSENAFEFSFFLGIIAIAGGLILEIIKHPQEFNYASIAGAITAMISGYAALVLLSKTVYTNKMKWFGFYTILAGITLFLIKP
ncbi:MAG: undecaprenyl-diphosphate phosphatase [Candidatus Ratteibacteria bacterium]